MRSNCCGCLRAPVSVPNIVMEWMQGITRAALYGAAWYADTQELEHKRFDFFGLIEDGSGSLARQCLYHPLFGGTATRQYVVRTVGWLTATLLLATALARNLLFSRRVSKIAMVSSPSHLLSPPLSLTCLSALHC